MQLSPIAPPRRPRTISRSEGSSPPPASTTSGVAPDTSSGALESRGVAPPATVPAKQISIKNTRWAIAYEYTYVYDNVKYHVYQIQIVANATTGYVFTYTATEDNYNAHLNEMNKVLDKVEF